MLTKEECNNALDRVARYCSFYAPYKDAEHLKLHGELDVLNRLIEEHFSNPPLTVADIPLEEEIMCWDNVEKEWCSIYSEGGEVSIAYFQLPTVYTMYETFDKKHGNRFYRKEVVQV